MLPKLPGIKVYGPYFRNDGRKHVIVIVKDCNDKVISRQTISYPKYLVEGILTRELEHNLTIDHIDNDFTNDAPSNLRILPRAEHARQDALHVCAITAVCVECDNSFTLRCGQYTTASRNCAGPFCSKRCIGKYGSRVQNGGLVQDRVLYDVVYSKNKDLSNL